MTDKPKMGKVAAVRAFFEKDDGRKIRPTEFLSFNKEDPQGFEEFARLCAEALGVELEDPKKSQ